MAEQYFFLADKDAGFLSEIESAASEGSAYKILTSNSVKDAQKKIQSKAVSFSGVLVNPNLGNPAWVELIKDAHNTHPASKVFAITEFPLGLTPEEVSEMGLCEIIDKPISAEELFQKVVEGKPPQPAAAAEGEEEEKEQAAPASEAEDKEQTPDQNYFEISLGTFGEGSTVACDLYLKLSADHYVKVVNSGDVLSKEKLDSYANKSVQSFFVLKTDRAGFVDYCNKKIDDIIKDPKFPATEKTEAMFSYASDLYRLFDAEGVSEENLKNAEKLVLQTKRLTDEILKDDMKDEFALFLKQAVLQEHAIATAFVVCLLLKSLGAVDESMYESIGVAAMFHDIGMVKSPIAIQTEDTSVMTKEQIKIFQEHPGKSAEILQSTQKVKPAAIEAVRQHHMRYKGDGFPALKVSEKINRIGEVIGLSDEYVRLMARAEKDSNVKPGTEIQKILPGFSEPVQKAFNKVFQNLF